MGDAVGDTVGDMVGDKVGDIVGDKLEGPENPTRQLLPIMSTKCCGGDGERRKDKGGRGGSRSKTKLCVTKLYVKDGA